MKYLPALFSRTRAVGEGYNAVDEEHDSDADDEEHHVDLDGALTSVEQAMTDVVEAGNSTPDGATAADEYALPLPE